MKKYVVSTLIILVFLASIFLFNSMGPATPKAEALIGKAACFFMCAVESGWCDEHMRSTCFLDCINWNC